MTVVVHSIASPRDQIMRATGLCCVAGLAFTFFGLSPAAEQTKSALETDPTGWIDLMPGPDLKGWKRVPLPPEDKLNAKNPWSVDRQAKVLHCDGVGVKEALLHEVERGDGIFHVEWRFRKVEGKTGYNSGVYVRTAANARVWHQAQVAFQDKPPLVGDLFGETLVNGQSQKFQVLGSGHKHASPIGDWNIYEITTKGKNVSVWLNGTVVTTWPECGVPRGHVGLQAEFWYIEFRNLKYRGDK
jgi:hypothetical protein